MGEEYILNQRTEVVLVAADRYELRVPLWGQSLPASREEVAILRRFERWSEPVKTDPGFLERCLDAGVLLRRLPSGKPQFPQRMRAQPTIFGAPHHEPSDASALTFLGVPLDRGPSAIRRASQSIRYTLDEGTLMPRGFYDFAAGRTLLEGVAIADAGDVLIVSGEDPLDTQDRITEAVASLIRAGTKPLILGGGGAITYAVLRAFPQERLGVIHFDARPDLGPIEPNGLDDTNVFSFVLERLEMVERVHQIGLRGLAPGGANKPARAHWYGIDRVRSLGAVMLAESLPTDLPQYVSIDLSVIHPTGLSLYELKNLLRAIASAREIVGIDLVGVDDSSAEIAVEALLTVADGVRPR